MYSLSWQGLGYYTRFKTTCSKRRNCSKILLPGHLGERVDGEGGKSVEVRIVEAASRMCGVAGGDGEDLVRRLGGPVRTGERETIVRPSV